MMARKPDLATDRVIFCYGGTLPSIYGNYLVEPSRFAIAFGRIPVDPRYEDPQVYPTRGQFPLRSLVSCGTVDEIVERFRETLTTAVMTTLGLDTDESLPFTTQQWEANEKFQAFLRSRGVEGYVTGPYSSVVADPQKDAYVKQYVARRDEMHSHPTLSRQEYDIVSDLLAFVVSGFPLGARQLADMLTRYADALESQQINSRNASAEGVAGT